MNHIELGNGLEICSGGNKNDVAYAWNVAFLSFFPHDCIEKPAPLCVMANTIGTAATITTDKNKNTKNVYTAHTYNDIGTFKHVALSKFKLCCGFTKSVPGGGQKASLFSCDAY